MKIISNKVIALLLCVLAVAAFFSAAAFAAESVDLSRKTSLTVNYQYNGTVPVPNAEFSLYQIGTVAETGELTVDPRFEEYGIRLDLTEAEDWATMAETVYGKLLVDGIAPVANGKTDMNGQLVLSELPAGVYLSAGVPVTNEGYIYTAKPFILTLPGINSDNEWEYDVTVKPKCGRQTEPPEETVSRKVMKVWKNDEGQSRPQQITVQLLCNGSIYDAQTLSTGNNWRYEWNNLDASCEWTLVEENVPTGYTVKVTQEDITFIVTNTYVTPPPPPDEPDLPQTGQLWWPVPILGFLGIFTLAVGLIKRRGNRNEG